MATQEFTSPERDGISLSRFKSMPLINRIWILSIIFCMTTVHFARAGKLLLVAGSGTGGDGSPADQAKLQSPFGVDFDKAGNLFFVEYTGQRVGKVDSNGILTTIAGTGMKGAGG